MLDPIVRSDRPVTLLGAGTASEALLDQVLALAPTLVCADGGADVAMQRQLPVAALIGDFDSVSEAARAWVPTANQFPIAEQNSTDFDKCLRHIEAPLVLGVGFEGSRLDHQMAAMNTLVTRPDRRCILVGEDQLVFLAPPELHITLPQGSLFSLFPMAVVRGKSEGLQWPIDTVDFAPDGRVGTSNAVTGPVRLQVQRPGMLVILPRAALAETLAALCAAPAHWPARAR